MDYKASKKIAELESENKILKNGISKALNGLEYSAYNLTKLQKVENLTKNKPKNWRRVESTCPEDTLLIEIRDLKDLIQ